MGVFCFVLGFVCFLHDREEGYNLPRNPDSAVCKDFSLLHFCVWNSQKQTWAL